MDISQIPEEHRAGFLQWLAQNNPELFMQLTRPQVQPQQQQQQAQLPQQGGLGGLIASIGNAYQGNGGSGLLSSMFGGGGSTAAAATPVGSASGTFGLPGTLMSDGTVATNWASALPYIPPIAATLYGLNSAYDFAKGDRLSTPQKLAMALPTAGLSLFSDSLQDAFGLNSKSTKDYQAERWGKLSPDAQGLYQANHPDNDTGVWKDGKYAGQKWSFEKASDLAKDDPRHFIGVLGNLETFDDPTTTENEWLKQSEDIQKETVRRILASGYYTDDNGDVLIRGKNKKQSQDIFNDVLSNYKPGSSVDSSIDTRFDPNNIGPVLFRGSSKNSSAPSSSSQGSDIASRYGAEVAKQVAAANASGRNVGVGGPGMKWDGKNFVRR